MNSDASVNVKVYSLLCVSLKHRRRSFQLCFKSIYLYVRKEMSSVNYFTIRSCTKCYKCDRNMQIGNLDVKRYVISSIYHTFLKNVCIV